MPGSSHWGQYYQPNFMENGEETTPFGGGFSDANVVTTSNAIATENTGSPSSSHSGGQLTPTKRVSKPIRRRSRVSKKTPITLLNANTTNFRALVQQFTGCAAAANASISFGSQKGPINLSFGPNNSVTSSVVTPFSNRNYDYQYQQQLQRLAPPPLQVLQEQQRPPLVQLQENQQFHYEQQQQQQMYPIDNVSGSTNDHVFQYPSSNDYNHVPSMEVVDGFVMDQEDIALHEFSGDLFSNSNNVTL